ncbi:MAG: hypothetical protein JWN66_2795 [Sphingomonas bacterium]|nr:hypothetical protein [Sphingomonas bacterium]
MRFCRDMGEVKRCHGGLVLLAKPLKPLKGNRVADQRTDQKKPDTQVKRVWVKPELDVMPAREAQNAVFSTTGNDGFGTYS